MRRLAIVLIAVFRLTPQRVVGTDIVEHLLGGTDPLGQEIRIDGWTFTGVTEF